MEKTPVIKKERKPYIAPKIVHEIELETRAGSNPAPLTLSRPDGLSDILNR